MHLKSIRLRGFKSFPEAVEVRLEPGVAVVVGPNGSGKSNVADALLWASGSLSPHELRAEKPDDVLFAGSPGHAPADFCEVELLFDNEDGALPELDFSEISITRRLHRGGEGQYLINRAAVRRTDLVELLADVGLGGSHGSVISQGKVEQILASKPEERRALIEDAAGLGKFKRRRHRAELKLARVQIQVERARDLEAEVKARLRPLALQATAAERAEKLLGEIAGLRARLAELDLAGIDERLAGVEERRAAASLERKRTGERLEALLAERNRVEEELAAAAGRGDGATSALYRLRSATERLELRRDAARELADRLRAEPLLPRTRSNPEREALREKARLTRERLTALEHSLAEREGLPPAARALAEEGERIALSLLEVESGYERAVAAALAGRAAALVAVDAPGALALVERARKAGLGNLAVLVPPRADEKRTSRPPLLGAQPLSSHVKAKPGGERVAELLADVWVAEPAELARAETGVLVTREGHCFDAQGGELWFAGETAEAILLQLDARRRALAQEANELERKAEELPAEVAPVPTEPLVALAERLAATLQGAATAAEHFEAPLRARVDAGATRAGELAAELRRLGGDEAEVRRAAAEAAERAGGIDVERARLEAEAAEARRRLEEASAEPAEGDDRDELAERIERLERRRETLGQVNPLAKEEYEREKERLTELAEQRADLEASLNELEELRNELAETVERRFDDTFAAVSAHFEEVASTLFPGGTGRLRLTDGEEEGEEPGVEVELRPVGKRVTRLSLLSGGEKALGAISFLFALFLARPCPFYLLDEVEAALDDANIGRFVELLRRYSESAQFIVVTHQKKTMEAADVLYGVTMGGDGVSQIVSRRLPREAEAAA
ncbi:MAG: chromosome segregation protein [Gaiellaceae bacterium]|jgi:chromosome segregation protein|nr:chromosome segregation protein [Gaiellaceae bacterium]